MIRYVALASNDFLILKISLLAARNERESVQIAIRPKVSWSGSGIAGVVQVQCSDLCSASGDRLVSRPFTALCMGYIFR